MDVETFVRSRASTWRKPTIDPKSFESLKMKTPISAAQYLEFSEKDLRLGGKRGLVNALTNAKRAIDCQVACFLGALGLNSAGTFPSKVASLLSLGVVAPRILNKIVRLRNMLEHEFQLPKKAEVEDAVDVATLFLEALKPYTSGGAYMSSGWLADENSANAWPIRKQGGLTYWRHSDTPKFTFSNGIYIDSNLRARTIALELVDGNQLLARHVMTSANHRFLHLQRFLLKCRPENQHIHSARGARELIAILK